MTDTPTYHYDVVYPYVKILQEVKDLIYPTILENADPEDIQACGMAKEHYADIIYTHVMALGYNEGDLKAAHEDIFPTRNLDFYPQTDELDAAAAVLFNLARIQKFFQHQVWAFQGFHQDTQALKPRDNVLIEVKKQLLSVYLL